MSQLSFDLEQHILRCWNVVEDIGEILDDVETGKMEIHEAAEALRAYQKVYQRRFERCFGLYEDFNREAWEARNRLKELEQYLAESKNDPEKRAKKDKTKQQKEVDH